jgi:hypothetical protein
VVLVKRLAVTATPHVKSLPRMSVSRGRSRRSRAYHGSSPAASRGVGELEFECHKSDTRILRFANTSYE